MDAYSHIQDSYDYLQVPFLFVIQVFDRELTCSCGNKRNFVLPQKCSLCYNCLNKFRMQWLCLFKCGSVARRNVKLNAASIVVEHQLKETNFRDKKRLPRDGVFSLPLN